MEPPPPQKRVPGMQVHLQESTWVSSVSRRASPKIDIPVRKVLTSPVYLGSRLSGLVALDTAVGSAEELLRNRRVAGRRRVPELGYDGSVRTPRRRERESRIDRLLKR